MGERGSDRFCLLRKRITAASAFGVALLASTLCLADVSPADAAAARSLFDDGRALVQKGKAAEACPKFEESQKLDPGIGTLYNLADCYERVGRTASAWALFLDVATQAKSKGDDKREGVARSRANALQPKLSKLTITVPANSDITGLEIKRDNTSVGKAMWGTAVAVDPGKHVIVATAPGRKRWVTTTEVGANAALETVTVPLLAEGAEPAPATSSAPATQTKPATANSAAPEPSTVSTGVGNTQRAIGVILGGAGVVTLGVAAYFGLRSQSKMDDSDSHCVSGQCDPSGMDLRDEAVRSQNVAYVTGGIGGALLIGGVIVFLTAPSGSKPAPPSSASTHLLVGPRGIGLAGTW